MASGQASGFTQKFYFWVFVAPVLCIIAVPLFLPAAKLKVPEAEVELLANTGRNVDAVNDRAGAAFVRWFVSTGLYKPSVDQVRDTTPRPAAKVSDLQHNWSNKVWLLVYRAMWRWYAFWPLYVTGVLGLVLPSLVDGLVAREKKRFKFGQYSSVGFGIAGGSLGRSISWLIILPIIPVTITPELLGGLFAFAAFVSWYAATNFQRGR
ncbi:DUF4400 domain-containing protein [Pandoraea sp. NPDC090278]|uniref:DUF4400 domain-containing protein n=1 Tax=Pandoraea sp. NPDC090278 TaxID=3364391 RepID=UPI003839EDF9